MTYDPYSYVLKWDNFFALVRVLSNISAISVFCFNTLLPLSTVDLGISPNLLSLMSWLRKRIPGESEKHYKGRACRELKGEKPDHVVVDEIYPFVTDILDDLYQIREPYQGNPVQFEGMS